MRKDKFFILLFPLFFFSGCVRANYSDVTNEYLNGGVIGKEFETKCDLIVYKGQGESFLNIARPGGELPEIKDISVKVPSEYFGKMIYGVISKGVTFKVARAIRSNSFTAGHDFFEAEVLVGPFKGTKVSTQLIETMNGKPTYDPLCVKEIVSVTK